MNRELILKLMKVKKQEYELFKEVIPDRVKTRVDHIENEMVDILKEFAIKEFADTSSKADVKKEEENKVKKVNIEA